jgi:predicted flap endonuclease-1-like 5' DNA nuclease
MTRFVAFLLTVLLGWLFTQRNPDATAPAPIQRQLASAAKTATKPKPSRSAASADDLTEIVGIGPVAAQALNELGIRSFKQLAAQNASELTQRLPSTMSGRVEREEWIEQARQLAKR